MSEPFAYLLGGYPEQPGPLGRFLPPLPQGAGAAWLRQRLPPGAWVLEPFGASPRLTAEAARAGYRVLATVNNPIARFLLELHALPPTESELRTALADLAVAQKAGERLEPLLRALYHSECAECRQPIQVQSFIWERQASSPSGKIYHCPNCKADYERPASAQDAAQAGRFASGELHRARALERVTPLDDPDRAYAEEALGMYLPRALYALVSLFNKLESFPPTQRRGLGALFLAAFDQANVLWAHPPGRLRPRQLTTPPRFLEKNIWLALEAAIESWTSSLTGPESSSAPIPLTTWPQPPPAEGGICVFEGRLKDLADQVQPADQASLSIGAVLMALPRPNQAYWTLSALWAGWLWGHAANASFKTVLHRRRYDWEWHTEALYSGLRSLAALLRPETPALGLIGETEPGFISAALLSAELAGFDLQDLALRPEEGQAQLVWKLGASDGGERRPPPGARPQNLTGPIQAAAEVYLRQLGEPADYLHLHSAVLASLAQSHHLQATGETPETSAAERFKLLVAALEEAFIQPNAFNRYGVSSRSLETGLWWLSERGLKPRQGLPELAAPLTDRVEMEVVRYLQKNPASSLDQVDTAMCAQFTGLLTPSRQLIQECLTSYGMLHPGDRQAWHLRPEDAPAARRADLEAMQALLEKTGARLGLIVRKAETSSGRSVVMWDEADGRASAAFYVIASAMLGTIVFASPGLDLPARKLIVLPGGRASLVSYKQSHDPALRAAIQDGWRLIKFRHLRRLADDLSLEPGNLDRLLDLDPLAYQDPQMPLL